MRNGQNLGLNPHVHPEPQAVLKGGVQTPSASSGLNLAPCLPFGRTWHDDIEMFHNDSSSILTFHTILLVETSEQEFGTCDVNHEEESLFSYSYELEGDFTLPSGTSINIAHSYPRFLRMPNGLSRRLNAKQRAWMLNDGYLQIGFCCQDGPRNFEIQQGLGIAMTLYDANVSQSGSILPDNHGEAPTLGLADVGLLYPVSWLFHRELGIAVWNRSLVDIRNQLLVKIGADMRGLDASSEYDRFLAEGHAYFLDFDFRV